MIVLVVYKQNKIRYNIAVKEKRENETKFVRFKLKSDTKFSNFISVFILLKTEEVTFNANI